MLHRSPLGTRVRGAGYALLSVLVLGGCASSGGASGGGGGSALRDRPPQVSGQSFAFTGQAHSRGRDSRVFEGEVRFLDDEWYIMEMWERPCASQIRRYSHVGDEITVRCDETGVELTLFLVEGRIMGEVEGPVEVRDTERFCADTQKINTQFVCVRWSTRPTERTARGRGDATVTRITG